MYQKAITINPSEYNQFAYHPLQTWEWGEFKARRGATVSRWVKYQNHQIQSVFQFFIHHLPFHQKLIYYPRDTMFDPQKLHIITRQAASTQAFMAKIEPYAPYNQNYLNTIKKLQTRFHLQPSPHPLFPPYTLRLDLTISKDQLWSNLHPKTRYNIRLARKKGVIIIQDSSLNGIREFTKLLQKTTQRQKFKAHDPSYYLDLYQAFKKTSILKIFLARYQHHTIAAWILFDFKNLLFYPYGASDYQYRRLMASNLLAWSAIRYGLQTKKHFFDLWGAAPPGSGPDHKWYGFTRFKLSYGAKYYRTIGSWDLIFNLPKYHLFNLLQTLRKKF